VRFFLTEDSQNLEGALIPGIDYDRLRQEIRMEEVLELIGIKAVQRNSAQ
jgi:hypothetical protein